MHIIPQRFTERRMERRQKRKRQGNPERWKVSSKEEKPETKRKEKVKERKDNVSSKSQNHQKSSGRVDLGNNGLNNLGMLKQTLRVGGMMIGNTADSNSQTSAADEEFQLASIGDLRHSNLGFAKHIESFLSDRLDPSQRTITFFVLIPLHA